MHLEDDLVGHCEEVLDIFNRAVMDGEERVVNYVIEPLITFIIITISILYISANVRFANLRLSLAASFHQRSG